MKYIYVVMVQLPTLANKISSTVHKFKYIHAAISLDKDLSKMYAFQIKNKDTPLVAGFMEETHAHYFHGKRNCRIEELVFEIPVSDEDYNNVVQFIEKIKNDHEYIFNSISTLFMFPNGGIKVYKAFHCIEFVCAALNNVSTLKMPKPTHKMLPRDLYQMLRPFFVKKRCLCSKKYRSNKDIFFQDLKLSAKLSKAFYSQKEAIYRTVKQRVSKSFDHKNLQYNQSDIKK